MAMQGHQPAEAAANKILTKKPAVSTEGLDPKTGQPMQGFNVVRGNAAKGPDVLATTGLKKAARKSVAGAFLKGLEGR